jgi:uncharacterized protein (DUF1697 family)
MQCSPIIKQKQAIMKKILITLVVLTAALTGFSQTRYYTKTGNVVFSAGTTVENIDGICRTGKGF